MTGIKTNSGKNLRYEWKIPANQVHFHKGGTFFMLLNLRKFPAALADPNGYILFETPESYLSCPHLSIGKRINIPQGISSIPGYINMKERENVRLEPSSHRDKEELIAVDNQDAKNPNRRETVIRRNIRDTATARALKQLHENKCQICGLALPIGDDTYSEAHHIQPLGEPHNGPDIPSNILVLCPNHHAQCDFGAILLNLNSLHQLSVHIVDDKYIQYHNNEIVKAKPA